MERITHTVTHQGNGALQIPPPAPAGVYDMTQQISRSRSVSISRHSVIEHITGKCDVIRKTGSIKTPSEQNRATATSNMRRKFGDV